MFSRKKEKRFWQKLQDWLWPRMGLKRTFRYYTHRIKRVPDTPYRIAAGFAVGAAVSFTPLIFFHLITVAIVCKLMRCNIMMGFLGTVIGNPYTFPFIWYATYAVGAFITGQDANFSLLTNLTFEGLTNNFWNIFFPMLVGGCLLAIPVYFSLYYLLSYIVRRHQDERRAVLRKAREKMKALLQKALHVGEEKKKPDDCNQGMVE